MSNRQMPPRRVSYFGVADFTQVLCAAVLLIAFFVMPWLVSATGLRVMQGTEDIPTVAVGSRDLLFLIPIVGVLSLGLTMIGVVTPRFKRLAAFLVVLCAVAGMVYYVNFLITDTSTGRGALNFMAGGFWITFICLIGLISQVILPRPRFPRREK
ncbi:MAG TPA: hypothetical protein PLD47_04115 [Aggregatilineales bacterium]|nr:hypothetical protein [Anaerolineales bacterium]HRE46887.1 hypothetical protein [Aggregatilineales bacterium]